MSNGNKPSALDILSCRKLVELYYGIPMVASIIESRFNPGSGTLTQILAQDPRRIRYEIVITNPDAAVDNVQLGSSAAIDASSAEFYQVPPHSSIRIERSFLTDLDAITLAVWATCLNGDTFFTTRETFLTPSAIDEIPDV